MAQSAPGDQIKLHVVLRAAQVAVPPIASHRNPHASDIAARLVREDYGPLEALPDEVNSDGIIHIGRRGGIYDEHAVAPPEKGKPRKCELTLVMERWNLMDRPELQALHKHILAVDASGQEKGMFKFGRLVERMWHVYRYDTWRIEHWARLLIEAAIMYEAGTTREIIVRASEVLECIRYAWERARQKFPPEACEAAAARIADLSEESKLVPFGLLWCAVVLWKMFYRRAERLKFFAPVWRQQWRRGVPSATTADRLARQWLVAWLEDAIRSELVWQQMFLRALEEVKRALVGEIVIRGVPVRVATITSDSPRVHSALTHTYPDIVAVAVTRSNGYVRIQRRKHHQPVKFEMEFVAAQLRAGELAQRGQSAVSWDVLVSQEGPEGLGWFFQQATQDIFQGSLTAVAVGTAQGDAEFQRYLVRGLDDQWAEWRQGFCREHGGTLPVRRPSSRQPEETQQPEASS